MIGKLSFYNMFSRMSCSDTSANFFWMHYLEVPNPRDAIDVISFFQDCKAFNFVCYVTYAV